MNNNCKINCRVFFIVFINDDNVDIFRVRLIKRNRIIKLKINKIKHGNIISIIVIKIFKKILLREMYFLDHPPSPNFKPLYLNTFTTNHKLRNIQQHS